MTIDDVFEHLHLPYFRLLATLKALQTSLAASQLAGVPPEITVNFTPPKAFTLSRMLILEPPPLPAHHFAEMLVGSELGAFTRRLRSRVNCYASNAFV